MSVFESHDLSLKAGGTRSLTVASLESEGLPRYFLRIVILPLTV